MPHALGHRDVSYKTPRRYYLHKRKYTLARDLDITTQWHGKQNGEPGTALPADFPSLAKLKLAFYTMVEDLDGADNIELEDPISLGGGLTAGEAAAVLVALAPLLP